MGIRIISDKIIDIKCFPEESKVYIVGDYGSQHLNNISKESTLEQWTMLRNYIHNKAFKGYYSIKIGPWELQYDGNLSTFNISVNRFCLLSCILQTNSESKDLLTLMLDTIVNDFIF
jgi:hypothetical protein